MMVLQKKKCRLQRGQITLTIKPDPLLKHLITTTSTKLVLTQPKIHLIPCQAGCLWGRWHNARINQEQTYGGNCLFIVGSLSNTAQSLLSDQSLIAEPSQWINAARAVEVSTKLLSSPTNHCHVEYSLWCRLLIKPNVPLSIQATIKLGMIPWKQLFQIRMNRLRSILHPVHAYECSYLT